MRSNNKAFKGLAAACLASLLVLSGCGSSADQARKSDDKSAQLKTDPVKQYKMRGKVMGLDPAGHVATIDHEKIEGFMEAMTMGYPVKDQSEFSKLTVGEPITATVYVQGDDMWIGDIKKDETTGKK